LITVVPLKGWNSLNTWNTLKESKFSSLRNQEQTEVRECLLSFGVESLVFQFAIKNV